MNSLYRVIWVASPHLLSLGCISRSSRFVLNRCHYSNVPSFTQSSNFDNLSLSDQKSPTSNVNRGSVLDECVEDVSHYAPYVVPTYNVAKFVNKSETLQELVKLGVDLSKIERNPSVCESILKLSFDDIKPYLRFFVDIGISADSLGEIITKSPGLLVQDLDRLEVRINYLRSKSFSEDNIVRIVTICPKWLLYQTQDIDERLGYWQSKFSLDGHQVRAVATRRPRLITMDRMQIEKVFFTLKEEIGFDDDELKKILLTKPKVYSTDRRSLLERWDIVTGELKLGNEAVVEYPDLLLHRASRLKARHRFLEATCGSQYDPTKPHYISPIRMLEGDDAHFAVNVAGTSVATYNLFLKNL